MDAAVSAAGRNRASPGTGGIARLGDELLARQASRGSARAFEAIYERYSQPLYGYVRSIVSNPADAQDVVQSTFAAALGALQRQQRSAPLRPWLYRIAHNEAISVLRRRRRDAVQELSEAEVLPGCSVAEEAERRARWKLLVADLAELPDRLRGALLMRELSGLSHDEIAIALGTTPATAKQAIFEARGALAELAEGRAMDCAEIRRRISAGDRRLLRGRGVRAHLRDCAGCDAFAASIDARRTDFRAFAPVMAPAVSAALLARTLHGATGHAVGGAGSAASLGASSAPAGIAAKTAATAAGLKTFAGATVAVVAVGAGVAGVGTRVLGNDHAAPAAPSSARSSSAATGGPTGAAGSSAGRSSAAASGAGTTSGSGAQRAARRDASGGQHGTAGGKASASGAVSSTQSGSSSSGSGAASAAASGHGRAASAGRGASGVHGNAHAKSAAHSNRAHTKSKHSTATKHTHVSRGASHQKARRHASPATNHPRHTPKPATGTSTAHNGVGRTSTTPTPPTKKSK